MRTFHSFFSLNCHSNGNDMMLFYMTTTSHAPCLIIRDAHLNYTKHIAHNTYSIKVSFHFKYACVKFVSNIKQGPLDMQTTLFFHHC